MKVTKRVTIKDIAQELNISLSTVNKALNDKEGVGEERRRQVLETAHRLGYRVNKVAQSLARKQVRIGIILPSNWPKYYDYIENGISTELKELRDYNVIGIIKKFEYSVVSNEDIAKCLDEFMEIGINAVILCPAIGLYDFSFMIEQLKARKIPVIVAGNSLTGPTHNLPVVSVDGFLSGKIAAELLTNTLPPRSQVVMFVGNKSMDIHNKKVLGFEKFIKENPNLILSGVYETQDEEEIAALLISKVLKENHNIRGIYIGTVTSRSICAYIEKNNLQGKIKLICTDLDDNIADALKKGVACMTFLQHPNLQGRAAVRILYEHISENKPLEGDLLFPPRIVLKSNLEVNYKTLYSDYQDHFII